MHMKCSRIRELHLSCGAGGRTTLNMLAAALRTHTPPARSTQHVSSPPLWSPLHCSPAGAHALRAARAVRAMRPPRPCCESLARALVGSCTHVRCFYYLKVYTLLIYKQTPHMHFPLTCVAETPQNLYNRVHMSMHSILQDPVAYIYADEPTGLTRIRIDISRARPRLLLDYTMPTA